MSLVDGVRAVKLVEKLTVVLFIYFWHAAGIRDVVLRRVVMVRVSKGLWKACLTQLSLKADVTRPLLTQDCPVILQRLDIHGLNGL